LRTSKYLPALQQLRGLREKKATRGERVISSLFPQRGSSYPGAWGTNKVEQVNHLVSWIYVAVHTICSRTASIMPNLAYVSDVPKPGVTTKACQRGLMNLGGRGFGGSPTVGFGGNRTRDSGSNGSMIEYSNWDPSALCSGGGHSFLTMGEYRSKALSVVKPHEELEPLESDHILRRLIENPNPVDTSFDLFYELGMFEELTGVSYLWLTPNDWGRPCELWVIPSHWVWPRTGGGQYVPPDNPNADRLVQYYEIRPWGGTGSAGMLKFPPEEVIMTRWKSPLNKIDGYSKLSAGAQWIDSEESVTKSRWAQFQNIARPEFWVELGPGYEDPDDDRISRVEAKFAAKIQGEYNYGKPIITPPGAKLTPLSFNPTEMAYFQSSDQLRDYVLALFNLSKVSVGISDSMTYGSILAVLGSICSFCLNPRLSMRGQVLTKHLASKWDEPRRKVKLWWDDMVPVDPAQVNSDLGTDGQFHAITPNEVRALRGRKPYRYGGDDPLVQGAGGIMPLPLNTGKDSDMDQLAKLVGEYSQAASPQQQGGGMGGMGGEDMGGGQGGEEGGEEEGQEGAETNGEDEGGLAELLSGGGEEDNAEVENPNSEPTKSYKKNGSSKTKKSLTWEQVLREADGIEIWEAPLAAD
jgi:phage portal protein BeeE